MGQLDRASTLWQWRIRRPGAIEWRILGRALTENEARRWAVANGYEIRQEAVADVPQRPRAAEPAVAPVNSRGMSDAPQVSRTRRTASG